MGVQKFFLVSKSRWVLFSVENIQLGEVFLTEFRFRQGTTRPKSNELLETPSGMLRMDANKIFEA